MTESDLTFGGFAGLSSPSVPVPRVSHPVLSTVKLPVVSVPRVNAFASRIDTARRSGSPFPRIIADIDQRNRGGTGSDTRRSRNRHYASLRDSRAKTAETIGRINAA